MANLHLVNLIITPSLEVVVHFEDKDLKRDFKVLVEVNSSEIAILALIQEAAMQAAELYIETFQESELNE